MQKRFYILRAVGGEKRFLRLQDFVRKSVENMIRDKVRFVLIQPVYSLELESTANTQIPLGLLTVATVLSNCGYYVKVVDLQKLVHQRKISQLNEEIMSTFIKMVLDEQPDVIGVSCMSVSYVFMAELVKKIKKVEPRVLFFLGGPHPTLTAKQTIEAIPSIDFVMVGESEAVLPIFGKYLEGKVAVEEVPNLVYRKDGDVRENGVLPLIDDLNSIPFLKYELIDDALYYFDNNNDIVSVPIEAGRGCPYNCTFCSTSIVWKRKFRVKSPERIVDEIRNAVEVFEANRISFIHDNMAVNKIWLMKLAKLIHEEFPSVIWGISARVDNVDEEILKKLGESGCRQIFFGVEAGSEKTQKLIRKNLKTDAIYNVLSYCHENDISATFSFIIGYPFEEYSDLEETFNMAFTLKAKGASNVQMHVLTPEATTTITKEYYDKLIPFDSANKNDFLAAELMEGQEIIKNKDIFTNCYHFPLKTHSYYDLVRLHDIAWKIMYMFPKTIYLLMKETNQSVLWHIERISQSLGRSDEEKIVNYLDESILNKKIIDKKLNLAFRYELFLKDLKTKEQRVVYSENNVYAISFPFKVKMLKKAIEQESEIACEKGDKEEYIIAISSRDLQTVNTFIGVSRLKYEIVKLLIAGETLNSAFEIIRNKSGLSMFFKKYFIQTLSELVKLHVLSKECLYEFEARD